MFGFKAKLPISNEDRLWVEEGFHRLMKIFGAERLRQMSVLEPNDQYFPDPFDKTERSLRPLFLRVCQYLEVDPGTVELEIIPDTSEAISMLPVYSVKGGKAPAGLHYSAADDEKPLIAIRQGLLKHPLLLIATLAHELGHVLLLDHGHMRHDAEDMEPMTDLLTVYFGFGIFNSTAAFYFEQHQDDRKAGWSTRRLGYLSEHLYGYALAWFAHLRGEEKPAWAKLLTTNVRHYFDQSARWIEQQRGAIE